MKRFVKDPQSSKDYTIDWATFLGTDTVIASDFISGDDLWQAATAYRVGSHVRLSTGEVLEVTVAGTSGLSQPAPPSIGNIVVDGSVTWLRSFNKESNTNTDTSATIWVSGGTPGHEYPMVNRITTNGGRQEDETLIFVIVQE
jgi:hypothetical protein